MKITLVCSGAIPCVGYGGMQRQVQWLALELSRRGHRVTIIADRAGPLGDIEVRAVRTGGTAVQAIPPDTDIVNFHGRGPRSRDALSKPFLNTAHNLRANIEPAAANWSFVSAFHAHWQKGSAVVHNGFPVDEYPLRFDKSSRLLFVAGVARPGKNLTGAVRLAKRFDFELDIAGGSRWALLTRSKTRREGTFFRSLSPRFRFHGIVDGARKMELLGRARAFLNPIRVEETFGMAPVEAMLCGTPVLATRIAAMPEIVDPDSGILFEDDQDFAQALATIGSLDPARIRESAADRFSISRTADGYLDLYRRILDGEQIGGA